MDVPKEFPYEKIMHGKNYAFKQGTYIVNFYEYNDIIVWGITANVLKLFLDNIKELSI
jgi:hypothetical protein